MPSPSGYVYDDGRLYFHSALSGHKVDAIRGCDRASFCVIDQDNVKPAEYTTYFRSVIAAFHDMLHAARLCLRDADEQHIQ